ncbi:hypothetical protein B0H17DRAFT_943858, partial [Mycena rosella]
KCDGRRPMCGPCSRSSETFGDCEYTSGGPSQKDLLEEQISILQARIEELEKPRDQRKTSGTSRASGRREYPIPAFQISASNTTGLGPLLNYFFHNFLHNATCFGFFLDAQAFHDAVTSTNRHNLPPVLLNVMYLWGVHLSNDERITAYEPAFLNHALRSSASSFTGSHPRTVLHSLQASVLLAYYFLRNGRSLEGKYHTSAAVSIALGACLHRIRSTQSGPLPITGETLPVAADPREEGERIDALWSVLSLNNCWMDRSPSNIAYGPAGLRIDTPWPLETRDYMEASICRSAALTFDTITRFLVGGSDPGPSGRALYAKAGILFEMAMKLGARYRTGALNSRDDDPEFAALERRIDSFIAALPAVQSKQLLVVHTIARVATIQLHKPLVKDHAFARTNVLSAARSVADIISRTEFPKINVIDPVLAVSSDTFFVQLLN